MLFIPPVRIPSLLAFLIGMFMLSACQIPGIKGHAAETAEPTPSNSTAPLGSPEVGHTSEGTSIEVNPLLTQPSPVPPSVDETPAPVVPTQSMDSPIRFDGDLGAPLIFLYGFGGEIYLQDVESGAIRMLDDSLKYFPEAQFGPSGWRSGGCSFLIRTPDYDIIGVDLRGRMLRHVFSYDTLQFTGEGEVLPLSITPSPSDEWISFIVGEGELISLEDRYEFHYEREDLYVMKKGSESHPYRLSQYGGAWKWEWSPDNTKLAYLDYDKERIFQVFTNDREAKNLQKLTNLSMDGAWWIDWKFNWSPDGKLILMTRRDINDGLFDYFVIKPGDVFSGEVYENADLVWWDDDGSMIVWKDSTIAWLNPYTWEGIKVNQHVPKPTGRIFVFDSPTTVACRWDCFGSKGFGMQLYDVDNGNLIPLLNVDQNIDIEGWFAAPVSYKGEDHCLQP
jgi:hypothetical protein